jgi:hypothetical protein
MKTSPAFIEGYDGTVRDVVRRGPVWVTPRNL